MTLLVRAGTGVDPRTLLPLMRGVVGSVDGELRIDRLTVADRLMWATLERERFTTTIMGAFALLALLLSSVGLYGVVSQVVTRRTREIGIRMALGARRRGVAGMVVRWAALAGGSGIVLGLVLALAGGRVIRSYVVDLGAAEVRAYVIAAVVLAGTALLAAWVPARRAIRIDPVEAMRVE